jgi:hypothetical protein
LKLDYNDADHSFNPTGWECRLIADKYERIVFVSGLQSFAASNDASGSSSAARRNKVGTLLSAQHLRVWWWEIKF